MSSKAADKRFASLKSDPRFRKQKADKFKVEIDDRFKSVLDEGGVFAKERGPGAKGGSRLYHPPPPSSCHRPLSHQSGQFASPLD